MESTGHHPLQTPMMLRTYKFPLKIEEKADIEVRALSPTNNMKCAATFCILLVQNES